MAINARNGAESQRLPTAITPARDPTATNRTFRLIGSVFGMPAECQASHPTPMPNAVHELGFIDANKK